MASCAGKGMGKGTGKGKKSGADSTATVCAHIGCTEAGCKLKCERCRRVFYCTQEHQRLHWKEGGHKKYCTPPPQAPAVSSAPTTDLGMLVGTSPVSQPGALAAATAAAAGPAKVCGACHGPKPVAAFSNSQLKKKAKRRCLECCEAGRPIADVEAYVDPVNPCPICLEQEDDYGKCSGCAECGQFYCGECNVRETMGRVKNCPTCRAPFAMSDKVKVERLRRLIGRSPGRHTPQAQVTLAQMYYDGGDYAEAAPLFQLAANSGFDQAQCSLGTMYELGKGVPQDHTQAVRMYRLAADQGSASAQNNLGMMYQSGTGVPQDYTEAVRLYRLAVAQGDDHAQCELGQMYLRGIGVPEDHTEAVRLIRLSADQGFAVAQFNLGTMYEGGAGVPQDFTETARLFELAALTYLAALEGNVPPHPDYVQIFNVLVMMGAPPDEIKAARLKAALLASSLGRD